MRRALLLLPLLACHPRSSVADPPPFTGDKDVDMHALDGTAVKLSTLARPVTVVSLWNSACEPCMIELPLLDRLAAEYQGDPDVAFLAVDEMDPPEKARETAQKLGLTMPVLLDKGKLGEILSPGGLSFPLTATVAPGFRMYKEVGFDPSASYERFAAAHRLLVAWAKTGAVPPPGPGASQAAPGEELTWKLKQTTRESFAKARPRLRKMIARIRTDLTEADLDEILDEWAEKLGREPQDVEFTIPGKK